MPNFEYEIIRSKRKTLAIYVNKDGSIKIRSPLNLSDLEIEKFVNSKEKWITEHIDKVSKDYKVRKDFKLNFGDTVKLKGENVPIIPIEGKYASFKDNKFYIFEQCDSKQIKQSIIQLYKRIAKFHIGCRINYFVEKTGIIPYNFGITNAKTRWGSCSGKNSINFSWRLIMASDDVIDYVIVHELCHIKEHNHSEKFWKEVESIIPNYKESKIRLRELEKRLNKEDWD